MALSVNTNVTSQTVQKNLNKAGDSLSTSMTRLSSGLKINSAKDDAAGMQIANRLTSQTKGMTVAIANANNGSSIAQTAEGAMQESTNILQRLRELALQSANGDKSDADRASLQQEFTAKTGELTRIAQTTTFGGRNLLDGSFTNQSFQIGADANQTISFGMTDISATGLKGSYSEASVNGAAMTNLSASSVGSALSTATTTTTTRTVTSAVGTGAQVTKLQTAGTSDILETDKITVNGKAVALTDGMKGEALAAAITKADSTVQASWSETDGKLTLTSSSAITMGGANIDKAGLSATPILTTTGAVATGAAVNTLKATGGGASVMASTDDITVNGKKITVSNGMTGAALATSISNAGANVVATFDEGTGVMSLTSPAAIVVGGADAAKSGLTATSANTTANTTTTPKAAGSAMGTAGEIAINGKSVSWTKTNTVSQVIDKMSAIEGIKSATFNSEGRVELTSTDGNDIKLTNTAGGSLAQLGLSAGTSQAKLIADTSIELNGVEVKFKKGDSADSIVSSINSASTGVTASKNTDGTLKLFSNKDITVKDGAAGTGLEALGLTAASQAGTGTGKTTATTVETTVADLSILSAADSQRTVQALADAIQQIDTQRSALGAVQNRFTSTVANLQSISENSTAALGRVQDTDFASEAAELTKQQTLQQASTAILSQANQLPSAVMKLLQ
ncbi:flagellin [Pseudomonas sp. FSL R10-0056]|uniref:flagellin N-terminal helical domain-containing protein n=1 Tax=unclassified Pseudomonas TaxID=196821 RepID=UPI001296DBE8|nr:MULTISPECIES: flagellin [unclassified Pseudomonas]MDN5392447.1 flagellin [Pseudomonas sp.]MDN5407193.1 flagellin [Pseudomonas sp.]MDN5454315.1 flagellin [Pseudomonas sp.]MDN5459372.1 flagellin [Pseudomonas sp.]MQT66095.1 flagellin [Pseudomonas sp. FSL R10-0056]